MLQPVIKTQSTTNTIARYKIIRSKGTIQRRKELMGLLAKHADVNLEKIKPANKAFFERQGLNAEDISWLPERWKQELEILKIIEEFQVPDSRALPIRLAVLHEEFLEANPNLKHSPEDLAIAQAAHEFRLEIARGMKDSYF